VGSRRRLALLAVAVLVVLIDLVVVVARLAEDDDTAGPPAEELLAAYERSRNATFAVDRTFTRTFPDGRSITYDELLVQAPPDDRLLVGGGAASGRLDGRLLRCAANPGGGTRCFEGEEAEPWADEVAKEVGDLGSLVLGPDRVYDVETGPDDGCFTLVLIVPMLAPPYGERAVFCYDETTRAPTRIEIHRTEASDVVETVEIRPVVTEADLRPAELGDLVTG
jgi:hypothetical protein